MFCKQCGNEIRPGDTVCGRCGNPVPQQQQPDMGNAYQAGGNPAGNAYQQAPGNQPNMGYQGQPGGMGGGFSLKRSNSGYQGPTIRLGSLTLEPGMCRLIGAACALLVLLASWMPMYTKNYGSFTLWNYYGLKGWMGLMVIGFIIFILAGVFVFLNFTIPALVFAGCSFLPYWIYAIDAMSEGGLEYIIGMGTLVHLISNGVLLAITIIGLIQQVKYNKQSRMY